MSLEPLRLRATMPTERAAQRAGQHSPFQETSSLCGRMGMALPSLSMGLTYDAKYGTDSQICERKRGHVWVPPWVVLAPALQPQA